GIEATLDAFEGLTQGARAVLEASGKGHLQGEYTLVADAIDVDREFALALETALGGSANDLIVPEDRDAKEAIRWLKERRAGRATFQPIPLMRPSEPSYELRRLLNERGIVGRASELARCAPRFRPVIDSLLGRVVIAETLEDALQYARTTGWSRIVTLEGEVVHGSGAVSGGVQGRPTYGVVQRRADLAEEAARTDSRRAEAMAELGTARNDLGDRQAHDHDLRESLGGVGEKRHALRATLTGAEKELNLGREREKERLKREAENAARSERATALSREKEGVLASIPDLEAAVTVAEREAEVAAIKESEAALAMEAARAALADARRAGERNAVADREIMSRLASLEGRK
ncbi:hypothetical protein EON79_23570, partial [bacterium]